MLLDTRPNTIHLHKLSRPNGLAVLCARPDEENAERIASILAYYLRGGWMEWSPRDHDDWQPVTTMPIDFTLRYRISR